MFGIEVTTSLMRASWNVFKKDKETIVLSILELLFFLGVLALMAYGVFVVCGGAGAFTAEARDKFENNPFYFGIKPYVVFFFAMFGVTVVSNFFTAAIVGCVATRFTDDNPNLWTGLELAVRRLPALLYWSVAVTIVRFAIRMVGRNVVARFIGGVAETSFNLLSFFTVPIIVVEDKNPWEALKESSALFKTTWGNQLKGSFGFGLIFAFLCIPGALIFIGGTNTQVIPHAGFIMGASAVYLFLIQALHTTLMAIFQTALYVYARCKYAPDGFDKDTLRNSINS